MTHPPLTITDSPDDMAGSPVSVQIVGRRLSEEYLLGVTRVLQDALEMLSI